MRQLLDNTGQIAETYAYDDLYRLTSASYSSGDTYGYSYDAVGNRLTMDSPQGSTSYTYDAANRLTSAGGQTYTWDNNGNLTWDGIRTYDYDHANRLKQVIEGTLTTQFAYNGDGVRTSKGVDGATTQYVLDLAATLPVVISDTDAIYLYGLDIIAEQLASADRYYYVHDGLGSARQLLDNTGQIAETYAYDPFGVPLSGGAEPNPFRFTGEAWDAEMELLYLRARYYQPETGRFITKDPWPGDVQEPGTLNGFVYVTNSPVNLVDPGGLQGPYDPYDSYQQSSRLISDWFLEQGDVRQEFGPNEPLTQDVRYSRGVQEFKRLWAEEGGYEVPWWWTGHSIDVREGPLLPRLYWGAVAYTEANIRRQLCRIGLGSRTPEGQIDPLDATLGSLEEISVHLVGTYRLRFEVFNQMGWASGSRVPGTDFHILDDVHRGESWGWGGTIYQLFYWFEPAQDYPDLKIRPGWQLLSRLWAYRW